MASNEILKGVKTPEQAYQYMVLYDHNDICKKIVSRSAKYSYQYACHIKHSWPQGEKVISKSAKYSYKYARDVLKGRFELGEPAIAQKAFWAYMYAFVVLKDRFPLGEQNILASEGADDYREEFIKVINCSWEDHGF